MPYPNEQDQAVFDACRAYVNKAKEEETIGRDSIGQEYGALGPVGHLAIAVSQLLDATSSEVFEDDEVRAILRCAKAIVDLGQ